METYRAQVRDAYKNMKLKQVCHVYVCVRYLFRFPTRTATWHQP